MTPYKKPLPAINDHNRPYWDALKNRRLDLLKCTKCGSLRTLPHRYCPKCGNDAAEWTTVSGRGTVWSIGIFHQVYFEGFRDEVPYNVAVIELDEGPRIYSNIVGTPNGDIRIGDRVEAVFDGVTPDVTLLKFRITR
jgi:uncharacterized OB-fold protein